MINLKLIPFLLSLIIFSSYSQDLEKISNSKEWLSLMHYEKSMTGHKSRIEPSKFFLTSNGKYRPLAELKAAIRAINENESYAYLDKKLPFQCLYPFRYQFLVEKKLIKNKKVYCEELNDFLNSLNANSVSIIFASHFASNPASIMGHTFLRFNSKKKLQSKVKLDLLDFALGYSALIPRKPWAITYAINGLFGGYLGKFNLLPYYIKVKEYNNIESRELWEYELNLNENKTKKLLLHLWELEVNSRFDYFFLDENCAFQLLAIIQAVLPQKNILNLSSIYINPIDTIKKLDSLNMIAKIEYRPSSRSKLLSKYNSLSLRQKNLFLDYIKKRSITLKNLDSEVLDTLINYFEFSKRTEEKSFNKILVQRSLHNPIKNKIKLKKKTASPHLSHDSFSTSIAFGSYNKKTSSIIRINPGIHRISDLGLGFLPRSELDVLSFSFGYTQHPKKFFLNDFNAISVQNFPEVNKIEWPLSWKTKIFFARQDEFNCISCKKISLELGIGHSFNLIKDIVFYNYLFELSTVHSKLFRHNLQFVTSISQRLFFEFNNIAMSILEYELNREIISNNHQAIYHRISLIQSIYHSRNLRSGLNIDIYQRSGLSTSQKYFLTIQWYF